MNIVVCGTIAHYNNMKEIKAELELKGHYVVIPPNQIENGEGKMIPVEEYYEIRQHATEDDEWYGIERLSLLLIILI